MTEQQIQISKDSELMVQVIELIASYAVENDMSPNETIKTVSENMLGLLEIVTFDNWEKKTLPSVISTSDDCVSREQAKIDVIPNTYYTSEQVIALLDNLSPVLPTHGTCKDCSHRDPEDKKCDCGHDIQWQLPREDNWYCADFKKRDNENER